MCVIIHLFAPDPDVEQGLQYANACQMVKYITFIAMYHISDKMQRRGKIKVFLKNRNGGCVARITIQKFVCISLREKRKIFPLKTLFLLILLQLGKIKKLHHYRVL